MKILLAVAALFVAGLAVAEDPAPATAAAPVNAEKKAEVQKINQDIKADREKIHEDKKEIRGDWKKQHDEVKDLETHWQRAWESAHPLFCCQQAGVIEPQPPRLGRPEDVTGKIIAL